MSITPLGVVTLAVAIVILVFWRRYAVSYVAATAAFPSSAAVAVGDSGISPFVVVAALTLILSIAGPHPKRDPSIRLSGAELGRRSAFRVFLVYSVAISLIGPALFAGTPVVSPRGDQAVQVLSPTPLHYTVSNVAQVAYLILGAGFVMWMERARLSVEGKNLVATSIWTGVGIAGIFAVVDDTGVAEFLHGIFDTSPTYKYQLGDRLRGQFAEPSVLGVFLAAAIIHFGFAIVQRRGLGRWFALAGMAIASYEIWLSRSVTPLVAIGATSLIMLAMAVLAMPTKGGRWVGPSVLGLWVAVTAIVWKFGLISSYLESLYREKMYESASYSIRSSIDSMSIDVFLESYGLGVGLGSHRPSSLLFMLLACVGVVGTSSFLIYVARTCRGVTATVEANRSLAWTLIGVIIALGVSKADLSTPLLWVILGASSMEIAKYMGCCQTMKGLRKGGLTVSVGEIANR